jgi:hypothetical protein
LPTTQLVPSLSLTLPQSVADGPLPSVPAGGRREIRRENPDASETPSRRPPAPDIVSVVERVVADAPPLSSKQRECLAVILGGGR